MAPPSLPQNAREPLVTAPARGEGGEERSAAEEDRGFLKAELRVMWMIGWPMAVSFFCRFAMMSMDAAFVGHIGDDVSGVPAVASSMSLLTEAPAAPSGSTLLGSDYKTEDYLAGASLSDMATGFMTFPLLTMAFGISPLVGQALGAGGAKMAGTWVQLAMFCITVASLPFHIAFFFVGDMLHGLGFHPNLCELAGRYAKFSCLWVIPNSWYVALRFYFQALGMARPAMYNGLVFLGINAVMNYILVFGGPFQRWLGWQGFGFIGAALSISISRILQCLVYALYMFVYRRAHEATWPGWNTEFLRSEHMRAFLAQVMPQVGTMLMQQAISQSITLLVAKLGSLAVAASSAATSATIPFTITFLATLSTLAAIRVGFHLGSGRADLARRTAWAIVVLGIALMLAFALVMLPLRFELMSMITSDEEVRDLAVQILPAVMVNLLATSVVQCGTGGILASQGRTRLSTFLSLFFELPLSLGSITILVLAFHADVRVVYWVQAAASVVEAVVVLLIVRRSDWERYAAEAKARQLKRQAPRSAAAAPATEGARNDDDAGGAAGAGAAGAELQETGAGRSEGTAKLASPLALQETGAGRSEDKAKLAAALALEEEKELPRHAGA